MMDATTCKGMLRRLQDGENCEAVDADLSSRFYCRHGQHWSKCATCVPRIALQVSDMRQDVSFL